MSVAAIVPAYNEEKTVGNVVCALREAEIFDAILVVDDGSIDATARVAAEAGARVLRLPANGGKGPAMRAGIMAAPEAEVVAFFDADLVGLTAVHARRLVEPVARGEAAMMVGLRDRGPFTVFSKIFPYISGERAMRRDVAEVVPESFWQGYKIELGFNAACASRGLQVYAAVMRGVRIRTKIRKAGLFKGLIGYAVLCSDVAAAMIEARALKKELCSPSTGSKINA